MLTDKKILITCGPTWIPIDDTRIISNKSTGQLAQIMAKDFSEAGAKVTLLEGPVAQAMDSYKIRVQKFYFYDDFFKLMKKEVKKNYDAVIHAAAVSDYKLKKPFKTKVTSQLNTLKLELVPTQKIIHLIKKHNPKTFLVGFKLESLMNKSYAKEISKGLFEKADCDLVIANTSTDKKYSGYILDHEFTFLAHETTRAGISKALLKIMQDRL